MRNRAEYEALYNRSISDPEGFWAEMASQYFWRKKVRLQMRMFILYSRKPCY